MLSDPQRSGVFFESSDTRVVYEEDIFERQRKRWEAQQKRPKTDSSCSSFSFHSNKPLCPENNKGEEDEDEDGDDKSRFFYTGRFAPVSVLAKDDLFRMVRKAKHTGDDEYDVQERVGYLDEFYGEQCDFARLRSEILSRFDPRVGLMRWSGIVWHADGVTAFFEGYDYWDAAKARRDFYAMLLDNSLWKEVVADAAHSLCICEEKHPGILTHPEAGLQLWKMLPWRTALRMRRVCKYTRRMYDTWIPLLFPERTKRHAKRKKEWAERGKGTKTRRGSK